MDFVVTLIAEGGETVGRLERQTESGTVAIRELRDPHCTQVADALALSLALALEPATANSKQPEMAAEVPSGEQAKEPRQGASLRPAASTKTPIVQTNTTRAVGDPVRGTQSSPKGARLSNDASDANARGQGWAGLQGGALVGITPNPLARVAAFFELRHASLGFVQDFSVRFAVVGALGSTSTKVGPVGRRILAGRGEGCPLSWGNARFSLHPCIATELGATDASHSRTGRSAANFWIAAAAGLRGTTTLLPGLSLEGQLEAHLPLIQNEIYSGDTKLYSADPVAFQGGVGLSTRLW